MPASSPTSPRQAFEGQNSDDVTFLPTYIMACNNQYWNEAGDIDSIRWQRIEWSYSESSESIEKNDKNAHNSDTDSQNDIFEKNVKNSKNSKN